jgi:WD40 repeat protein
MESSKANHSVALLTKPQEKPSPSVNLISSFKNDFSTLSSTIQELSPSFIQTPFKGAGFVLVQRKPLDLSSGRQLSISELPKSQSSEALINIFVIISKDGKLGIFDVDKKELIREKNLEIGEINAFCVSNDGKCFFTTGRDRVIRKWFLDTLQEENDFWLAVEKPKGEITKLAISHNNILVSAGEDKKVLKWNLSDRTSTVLYRHKKVITGLDISQDGTFVFSCSNQESVIGFNIEKKKKIFERDFRDKEMHYVKISPKNKFISAGIGNGEIFVWNVDQPELEHELEGHQDHVNTLYFTPDETKLISGGADNLIKVWDMTWQREEVTLYGHSEWVTGISMLNNLIYTLSDDSTIMMNKFVTYDNHHLIYPDHPITSYISTSSGSRCFAIAEKRVHEYTQGKFKEFEHLTDDAFEIKIAKNNSVLVIFMKIEGLTQFKVFIQSLEDHNKNHQHIIMSSSPVMAAEVSEDAKWLITGESFRVTVWESDSGVIHKVIRSHTSDVTALTVSGDYLFAGEQNGVIKLYNMAFDYHEMGHFAAENNGGIRKIVVSEDKRYLVSSTSNNKVFIWSTQTKSYLKVIQAKSTVSQVLLSEDSKRLFFSYGNLLEIWNMENFSKCSKITEKYEIITFYLKDNDSQVVLANSSYMKILNNPFKTENFSIYGHFAGQSRFVNYLLKVIKGERPKYDESMNSFLIEPYHINVLHIYAFYNLNKHLQRAISSGGSFIPSKGNYTPLSISVDKKLQDCIECIFESFKPRADHDPFVFYYFSETLAALNRSSYPKLHLFYDMVYRKTLSAHLPKFCSDSVSLPIRSYSDHLFINKEEMMKPSNYESKEIAIEFYQSYVQLPIQFGSSESLNFMRSLIDCKNTDLFSSSLIRRFVEDKWKTARIILIVEGLLYFTYLFMICAYVIFQEFNEKARSRYELTAPMGINLLLFFNEILQMAYTRGKYFTSFWNYIDLARFSLFTFYFVLVWLEYWDVYIFNKDPAVDPWFNDSSVKSYALLSSVLFSLVRGSSYFRINSSTRWVVNLVFEVIYQLNALIIVTFYAMLAFVVVYNYYSESGFDNFLSENHEIAEYEYFLMFVVLIINPIIMLNLFIAIVGETFEKTQDEKHVKNGQDLAEVIFEAELLFLCCRKLKKLQFLHEVCEEHGDALSQISAGQRMKRITQDVDLLCENTLKNRNEIAELAEFVQKKIKSIQKQTDEVVRRVSKDDD